MLAYFFHSGFPRWDLTFNEVNATFSHEDPTYRESLIIWAAVPVLWLVLTLLLFLLYFCYRCCQRDIEKKQRVPCLRWTMTILALLTCAVIGVGFYGNEQVYKGISAFASSWEDANNTVDRMEKEVDTLQDIINDTVDNGIESMQAIYRAHPTLEEEQKADLERFSQRSSASARAILHSARHIRDKAAARLSLATQASTTSTIGFWLWIGIILLLSCFILLCLNLLVGIGRSSKCILLLFCALGIIFLVVCWIAAGIFLATSLAVSDFCVDPNTHVQKMVNRNMGPEDRDVLRYYIVCDTRLAVNPFRSAFQEAQDNVRSSNNTLNRALNIAYGANLKQELKPHVNQVNKGLDNTVETLLHLTALVECTSLHRDYDDAVQGVCSTALPGVVFLLLSTVVTGPLLTILVLMASRAWRHFSRRKGYQEVEEDDPFLPRPDPNSPSYYSFTRQGPRGNPRAAGAGEQITMQRRNTPPPASPDAPLYRSSCDAYLV